MSSTTPSGPAVVRTPEPVVDTLFGSLWPEAERVDARPRLVAAALAVGLLAALVLPFRAPGVGAFAVLVAACAVVARADRQPRSPYLLACRTLVLLLGATIVVRDATWVVALCMLAALGLASVALTGGRSVTALLASGTALPLAGLRGLPWLGRSVTVRTGAGSVAPVLRTVAVSAGLLAVFGALFASADALFARWVGALVPDLTVTSLVLRGFVLAAVGGLTLAGTYVALNPPRVERLALPDGTPVGRRFEWLVPVALVDAVFAVFVAAQLTAMFGGHAYLQRTTGLTYASYVHQGFGQLTVATGLTLGVVAAAVRKAPQASARDRWLLRALLGLLCSLALVVVASALYRLAVYEQAYGWTRLRLLAGVVEGWLGLLVLLVMAAGVRLSGSWVPRAAVLTAGAALLALAWSDPDAAIARHDVARWQQTGRADWAYLSSLSADAVPALAALPADVRGCVVADVPPAEDWLAWNLGRAVARHVPHAGELRGERSCPVAPLR